MIELWELGGRKRLPLQYLFLAHPIGAAHKGLGFATHAVSVTDKDAITFSGQDKVPILRHGDLVVSDSWKSRSTWTGIRRTGRIIRGAASVKH